MNTWNSGRGEGGGEVAQHAYIRFAQYSLNILWVVSKWSVLWRGRTKLEIGSMTLHSNVAGDFF